MTFCIQWLTEGAVSIQQQLDAFQEQQPGCRLVNVMVGHRNPGGAQHYQAIWERAAIPAEGELHSSIEFLIEELILAEPYTDYEFVAQNKGVEMGRALRHARLLMRELAKRLAVAQSASAPIPGVGYEAFTKGDKQYTVAECGCACPENCPDRLRCKTYPPLNVLPPLP